MNGIARYLTTIVLLFGAPSAVLADTITLRPSIRMPADSGSITLADVASLEGPDALRFADVTIAPIENPSALVTITVDQVRAALDAAEAPWGKVNLNGSTVTIRPRRSADSRPPAAMQAMAIDNPAPDDVRDQEPSQPAHGSEMPGTCAVDLLPGNTLRAAVTRMMVRGVNEEPDAVRLRFDDADAALLDQPDIGRRFEIQPLSSLFSDRVELVIRTWDQDAVIDRASIRVDVWLRRDVAIAATDLERDHIVVESDLTVNEQWVKPSQATQVLDRIGAIGRVVTRAVSAGQVVRAANVRQQTLVGKGDPLIVRCVVGGVVISVQALAAGDGALGDTIECRREGDRETFMAVVTGRGEAVVDLADPANAPRVSLGNSNRSIEVSR